MRSDDFLKQSKSESGSSGGSSGSSHVRDGIFVEPVKIVSVEVLFDDAPVEGWEKRDLCLIVGYEPEGKDLSFTPEVTVSGNYNRDDRGKVVPGWPKKGYAAENILKLLARFNVVVDVQPDGTFDKTPTNTLIGRRAMVLSYASDQQGTDGKDKIKTLPDLWPVEGDEDKQRQSLADNFFERYASRGYPRNYRGPDTQARTSAPGKTVGFRDPASSGFGPMDGGNDAFSPSDDLPF